MPDLTDIPETLFCAGFFLMLLISIEAGHWLGRRATESDWEAMNGAFLTLASSALALLGLLLAFSFSMAVNRYEARQYVILKEANAISRAYVRSDFLKPEHEQQVKAQLRAYVDLRLAYHEAGHDATKTRQLVRDAEAVQRQVWKTASVSANYNEQSGAEFSMLAGAINDVAEIADERQYTIDNQVPSPVIWLMIVVALPAAAMGGYAFGARRRRNWLALAGFALMITLVVYNILDLDRPSRGWILIDQAPMLALKAGMG